MDDFTSHCQKIDFFKKNLSKPFGTTSVSLLDGYNTPQNISFSLALNQSWDN